jgi:uncharacterized membrane protein HdeD (DUF308 family)
MLSGERMIVRQWARYWWVFLVSGILWLLIAWVVLRGNQTSIAAVGVLIGVVFLLAGSTRWAWPPWCPAAGRSGTTSWRSSSSSLDCGVLPAGQPLLRARLGARADPDLLPHLRDHPGCRLAGGNPYWWVNLITGILLLLLAFWVSGSDRVYALAQRTVLILFWVGFFALFRGFSQIFMAFAVRHEGQEATAVDAAGRA